MKINWLRILIIGLLFVSFGVSIYCIINTLNYSSKIDGDKTGFILDLLGFIIIAVIQGFEIYWIFRSFKRGTQILSSLCFNINRSKNKLVFIFSIITTISFFVDFIWFLLIIIGINPLIPNSFNEIDNDFFMLLGLFGFINSLFVFLYTCFMANEDINNFNM